MSSSQPEQPKRIRFQFPPGATPKEIADALNRLREQEQAKREQPPPK